MPGRNFKTLYNIAEDNYGFVTVEKARQAGVRPQRLAEMARRGALHREGRALYRLDPFPPHELDSYRKATLWPYPVEGVLSHETALELFELSDVNPRRSTSPCRTATAFVTVRCRRSTSFTTRTSTLET